MGQFNQINEGGLMGVVVRYDWEVDNLADWKKNHAEFRDQYLNQSGASGMELLDDHLETNLYFADVHYQNWAGLDQWRVFFNSEKGLQIAKKIMSTGTIMSKRISQKLDY
jgi:hypothetical protein